MARNWHLCDPIRHPGGTYLTRSRHLDVWLANSGSAPWKHHGTTQRARIWHRYVTLIGHCRWRGCVFTMKAPCVHLDGTIATRWQHHHGSFMAPLQHASWTQTGTKNLVPSTNHPPFFVLVDEAQRMGPLGQISGESWDGGILGTKPLSPASKATAHLRPLAALPPLAVLWPEVPTSPWCQPAPAHKSLRSRGLIAPSHRTQKIHTVLRIRGQTPASD